MNLLRLQRLSEYTNSYSLNINKIISTGFLLLGILSFCFGQNASTFAEEYKAAGTTKSEKKSKKYYTTLRSLQSKYESHLENNCNDKASLYRNLGIHFYNNDEEQIALQYFQDTALQIALNCPTIDYELFTQIYLNIINSNIVLDQKQSIPPIIERLKWHLKEKKAGPLLHQAKIQSQISRYYEESGDYDQAMLWIRNSIANHNKLPLSEKKLRAYLEMTYILMAKNEYWDAIALLDSTKLLAVELNIQDIPRYNEDIIYNKAVCYEDLGLYEQALHFNQIYASMTDPNDLVVRSDIENLKSFISLRKGNYQQALLEVKESINLSLKSRDEYQLLRLVKDYLFISKIYRHQKNYSKAANAALNSLSRTIVQKENWQNSIFNFSNLLVKNPNGFNKAAHSFFNAIVHYESEENIIAFADQLDSTFFSLQTYFSGDESKSEVTSRHHDFCDEFLNYIFDNQLEDKYPQLTSYYISTSKSLSLFEKLSIKQGIPEDLKPEFNALNEQWNDIYSELETQEALGNRAKIDSLATLNFQLSLRKDKLDEQLTALQLIPDFRNLRSDLITQAQSKLRNGEAIIDFFYGNDRIYSWYLLADQIKFNSAQIHPILEADFISTFSSTDINYLQSFDEKIDSISNYFSSFFPTNHDISSLTIIPDGQLLYFPFEVLQVDNQSLLDRAHIHYLFSYSIGEFQRSNNPKKIKPYVGFAMEYNDPILKDILESEELLELFNDTFSLSKLPFAIEEVKLANEIFSGTSYLNEACTKEVFFKEADNYQILHIANHALLNEQNSYLSSIVFGNNDQADMINGIDIKKLQLNADLAILSSCNTGRGEHIKGSGLRSIGLSFAEAGCPAILVNLWEASDKSTKQIIESFSRNLKKGMVKSLALQKAKQKYIQSVPRELQHPKYWANMVLIGNDSPIELTQAGINARLIYFMLFILLLIVAGIAGKKFFSK